MAAIVLGVISALSLGIADFLANRNAIRLGADRALCGMLAVGVVGLSAYGLLTGAEPPDGWLEVSLILLHGVAVALALLLFFAALAQGPITVVAPIVGAHPVLVVAFVALTGRVPSPSEIVAMTCVVLGVVLVGAMTAGTEATERANGNGGAAQVTRSVLLVSGAASTVYAVAVIAGQESAVRSGDFETLWFGRLAGFAFVAAILFFRRRGFSPSLLAGRRKWMILAHGALDAAGFFLLLAGGKTENPEYTAVVSSTFSVVTVVLACLILRERMSLPQIAGVVMIVGGVVTLGLVGT